MKAEQGLAALLFCPNRPVTYTRTLGTYSGNPELKEKVIAKVRWSEYRGTGTVAKALSDIFPSRNPGTFKHHFEHGVGVPAWTLGLVTCTHGDPEASKEAVLRLLEAVPVGAQLDRQSICDLVGRARVNGMKKAVNPNTPIGQQIQNVSDFYDNGADDRRSLISNLEKFTPVSIALILTLKGGDRHKTAAELLMREWGPIVTPNETANVINAIERLS